MLCCFDPAYAPFLLEEKARQVRRERVAAHAPHRPVMTVYEKTTKRSSVPFDSSCLLNFSFEVQRADYLARCIKPAPFDLFGHETIIQLLGIYMAFVYGIFYVCCSAPKIKYHTYHSLDFQFSSQIFLIYLETYIMRTSASADFTTSRWV